MGIVAISAFLFDTKSSSILNSSTPPKPKLAISSYLVQLPEKPKDPVSSPNVTSTATAIATSPLTPTQASEENSELPTEITGAEESTAEKHLPKQKKTRLSRKLRQIR
ncbi:hypothetical protein [Psychrosphaera algicola]|uniref:Uncharacterized protein n=1 Tax=Psychrosphaera algicola TaxID=3023714 RepID=A0ABT5FGN0_9GAMM|nr:hypothetical protein [Psychrosphaera sp. G1-22]MDC2889985.1 hypothetical protein [Psychrosphaera sp. G1-22]